MEELREIMRRRATRRSIGFWYRMGQMMADVNPPEAYAHSYNLGRKMAELRRAARPEADRPADLQPDGH